MPAHPAHRRTVAVVVIVAGIGLLAVSVSALFTGAAAPPAATAAAVQETSLHRAISAAQSTLRRNPRDAGTWARLGAAYVEQARVTGDPGYYPKAQGALERSLQQQPDGNGGALIGMGALANARHDFAAARDWGRRASIVLPDTAEVYGVLADADTQLGDADAATTSVQRMLDLKPGVSSFTRAAYDLERHGDTDEAQHALERALADAVDPGDVVFCRYYLGELAFDTGRLDQAEQQYEQGLRSDPRSVSLLQGRAKVAAARGRIDDALAGYRDVVERVPSPQYLHEYALLLLSAGRAGEAAQQFGILEQQQKLYAAAGAGDDLTASVVAADQGNRAEALRRAEAEWARRQDVVVADAYSWALHLNGRDAQALDYAQRAGALGWHNAVFSFHRGMILAALGRDAQAADALAEALRTNPSFSPLYAQTARQTLTTLRSGR